MPTDAKPLVAIVLTMQAIYFRWSMTDAKLIGTRFANMSLPNLMITWEQKMIRLCVSLNKIHPDKGCITWNFCVRITLVQLRVFWLIEYHDDVIKWKHFRVKAWSVVRGIHRSTVTKASDAEIWFFRAWTNGWAKNRDAGDLRRDRSQYYVTMMVFFWPSTRRFHRLTALRCRTLMKFDP